MRRTEDSGVVPFFFWCVYKYEGIEFGGETNNRETGTEKE